VFIPRESRGCLNWAFPVRVGFGLGAIWSGLLLEERRDVQRHAAVGLGGDRIAKAFIRPVEAQTLPS
jgi:hypothetical protein